MSITQSSVNQVAHPQVDARAPTYENAQLALFDLFRGNIQAGGGSIIEGRTFTNCRIEGPAIMLVLDGVTFEHTNFGPTGGDMRSILFKPLHEKTAIGAIPMRNCKFVGCEFFALGFTGHENMLKALIEQVETRAPGQA